MYIQKNKLYSYTYTAHAHKHAPACLASWHHSSTYPPILSIFPVILSLFSALSSRPVSCT